MERGMDCNVLVPKRKVGVGAMDLIRADRKQRLRTFPVLNTVV